MTIMYVCDSCYAWDAEKCGRFDRNDLRVLPNGEWLCEECFSESDLDLGEDKPKPDWNDLQAPPEYVPSGTGTTPS